MKKTRFALLGFLFFKSSFNEKQSAWVTEAGEYKISVGSSSKNINLTSLFTLPKTLIVQKVNNV